jgi:hypothetical protein
MGGDQSMSNDPILDNSITLRYGLVERYLYLTLKFSHPIFSETGRWECSWNGGSADGATDAGILAKVLVPYQATFAL